MNLETRRSASPARPTPRIRIIAAGPAIETNALDSAERPLHWKRMTAIRAIALLAAMLVAATAAEARLVSQRVMGASRVCVYENPIYNQRRSRPLVEHRIGRGEPCPTSYPTQAAVQPAQIPTMATLAEERHVGGEHICVYRYMGRNYPRPIRPGQYCPLTPHFFY
jgi:hypothetical protein